MPVLSPRYWLKADAGRTSPVNSVTESGPLTGGTVTLTDLGGGNWAYVCTGAASSATFTPLTTDGGGVYGPPDGSRTIAIRAAIATMPSSPSFARLFGFTSDTDLDTNGIKIARNGSDTSFLAWAPGNGDSVVIDSAMAIGTALKTVVIRLNANSGIDTMSVWVQRTDRAGATTADFVSTGDGSSYFEALMALQRFIVQPGDGSLRLGDAIIWPQGDLTDAECAAVADGLRATMSPPADTTAPTLTSPTGTGGTLTGTGGITSSEAGTHYWQATTSATPLTIPTAPAAMTGWTSRALTATAQTWSLGALSAGTYYVHNAAEDAAGNRTTTDVVSGSFVVAASGAATAVTLTGPSSGVVSVASTSFTAGANGTITGTVTVTPSAGGGGGTFSPTSVAISSGTPTATFTYTPGTTGAKSISVTNNGSLSNPGAVTYTVSAAPAPGSGTLTSGVLKRNNGTPAGAVSLTWLTLLNHATGAFVATKTGVSTNSSSIFTTTDAGMTVGVVYRAVWLEATGQSGHGWVAAT